MSKVNFVSEFNLFMRYARDNSIPMRERMLWIALFYVANDRATFNEQTQDYDWPDEFISVSNSELNLYCCLDKRGIETLRNSLKQRGLIDFRSGEKNKRNPSYRLNYLSIDVGYKKVPNDVPNITPNDVPNSVPNITPNYVPNITPNYAPNSVPNVAENHSVLGTKMSPTLPPFNINKRVNINNSRVDLEADHDQRSTSNRNGGHMAEGRFDFVNLEAGQPEAEFVPLPREGVR